MIGNNLTSYLDSRDGLKFSSETMGLLTEFRSSVLNFIHSTALGLCNEQLESAEVTVTSTPDEEESYALDLIITVNTEWQSLQAIECQILDNIAERSIEWSAEELEDYATHIYFVLLPCQL